MIPGGQSRQLLILNTSLKYLTMPLLLWEWPALTALRFEVSQKRSLEGECLCKTPAWICGKFTHMRRLLFTEKLRWMRFHVFMRGRGKDNFATHIQPPAIKNIKLHVRASGWSHSSGWPEYEVQWLYKSAHLLFLKKKKYYGEKFCPEWHHGR